MTKVKMKQLTSAAVFASLAITVPAMAAPTHTSATFPQSGVMEEDYQYTGQANVTNLKVASGTANTLAGYTDCPSGYPNSDEGATSTDECYTACTVSDFPANSHIASVTGKNYQGSGVTDTCAIATCETGYTLTNHIVYPQGTPNLTEIIGESGGLGYGYIDHSGTYTSGTSSTSQASLGIGAPDTWGVVYGVGQGLIKGKAICSIQSGTNDGNGNATTSTNVAADFSNGQNCWCQLDGYTSSNSYTSQSLSAPWVFKDNYDSASLCASDCASDCGVALYDGYYRALPFRAAVFASLGNSVASCDANVITINWDHADAADITANDAGSVTYGGNINTPKKAQHINGKIFTGWTFVTPQQ